MDCAHDWEFVGEDTGPGENVWCSLCGAIGYRVQHGVVHEIRFPKRHTFWDGCTEQNTETPCHKREDGQHCNCWYDGNACCACNAPAVESR